ncbi:signal transduction histidine kinase [Wenyingzhuangia heitensis]|uniref:histidine kinase n=1 Tax=Wenyingzhuangia heitensis TaxID=1487859 RepID=A0ABX0U5T0_9FLAO|nr:HAMP domain-containing sensor histidine kinase [Wenyingzhuangia heitensis]NIJ44194.1 signal transduction histidine kinase [Wenyingzhuangia heitensis]
MKLLNQSLKYLSGSILIIITLWAVVFYLNMLQEIKKSIDEGLENYKRIIIQNAKKDPTILTKTYFDESFFTIHKINKKEAFTIKDQYKDTLLYMQDFDDEVPESEPVRMLTTAFKIDHNYYLLNVANSMVEEDDLIKELLYDIVVLYLFLVLSIILINNIMLKKLWHPFYSFLNQLKIYKLGNTQKLPKITTETKEFMDLQKAVNTLLEQNLAVFEQQKQFIGNASHELQTPLAITTNKLELLLEDEQLNKEQANTVSDVFKTIQKLVQLNKSLLLLSKIDNKHFFNNKVVNINKTTHDILEHLQDFSSYKNISISCKETAQLSIEIDIALANIVVSNLIKNAIIHNTNNGSIEIFIDTNSFTIKNTGINKSLDANQIFNRFHKSTNKTDGSGLGLAIVKAISDLYGFSIVYSFKKNSHCFNINFTIR